MYRSDVRGLSVLTQAQMEALDDYLTFEEVSVLVYPDGMPSQRKEFQDRLLQYYKSGKLIARKGQYDKKERTLSLPGVSHKEAYPRITYNEDHWLHRDDFKQYLEINGFWPLEDDSPLAKWFVKNEKVQFYSEIEDLPKEQQAAVLEELGVEAGTKTEFASEPRENELHQMIEEYYGKLHNEKETKNDTSRIKCWDLWNYIKANRGEIDLIDDMTRDSIEWSNYKGKQISLGRTTFGNIFTRVKKLYRT
jgi:hypothetical protein